VLDISVLAACLPVFPVITTHRNNHFGLFEKGERVPLWEKWETAPVVTH